MRWLSSSAGHCRRSRRVGSRGRPLAPRWSRRRSAPSGCGALPGALPCLGPASCPAPGARSRPAPRASLLRRRRSSTMPPTMNVAAKHRARDQDLDRPGRRRERRDERQRQHDEGRYGEEPLGQRHAQRGGEGYGRAAAAQQHIERVRAEHRTHADGDDRVGEQADAGRRERVADARTHAAQGVDDHLQGHAPEQERSEHQAKRDGQPAPVGLQERAAHERQVGVRREQGGQRGDGHRAHAPAPRRRRHEACGRRPRGPQRAACACGQEIQRVAVCGHGRLDRRRLYVGLDAYGLGVGERPDAAERRRSVVGAAPVYCLSPAFEYGGPPRSEKPRTTGAAAGAAGGPHAAATRRRPDRCRRGGRRVCRGRRRRTPRWTDRATGRPLSRS